MNEKRQETLLAAWCLLIGEEASIDFARQQLASAGVGFIKVASNQELDRSRIASDKANPDVKYAYQDSSTLTEKEMSAFNIIIEACEDWQYKLKLSDLCMRLEIPLIHSGTMGPRMQVYTMMPGRSACLRCALPIAGIDDVPLTPSTTPSFKPVSACTGAFMALEAIKIITGLGVTQGNEMWKLDALSGELEIIRGLDPQRGCPDCGK